jgi:ethanolamine ammonia-lyase large subunit
MDALLALLCAAGVNFVITVPGADDIMLNYQTLLHHDAIFARDTPGRRPAPEFDAWLSKVGVTGQDGRMLERPLAFERTLARLSFDPGRLGS